MKGFLLFCLASSLQNKSITKDAIFNKWCTDVGIECSAAEVRTTPESVAGRGVFSTQDIAEGDEVISIPLWAALTQDNAARYFPTLSENLVKCRTRKPGRIKRIWNRIRRKPIENDATADDYWQAELTAYAQAALDVDHPWSDWISQWERGDPLQALVDQGNWAEDDEAINTAVSNFHNMAPDIPKYKIHAAVGIRLQELDGYKERYQNKQDIIIPTPNPSLYTTLISRAIGLSSSVTAILPMHDMINHSTEPNVGLAFAEDGTFKMIATKDIAKDTELFTHYLKYDGTVMRWDEDKAAWLLVQWGIPSSPSDYDAVVKDEKVSDEPLPRV